MEDARVGLCVCVGREGAPDSDSDSDSDSDEGSDILERVRVSIRECWCIGIQTLSNVLATHAIHF